jgi:WD40 repeat protein/serine/threonine protein kinase
MGEAHKPAGEIFEAAMELPPEQRAACVREACAGDDSLRQRVEALLRAHESAGTFMDSPAVAARGETVKSIQLDGAVPSDDNAVGQTIGRYKLLEKVGEGGCGAVYVAQQNEPVRRRVALKVIKLGMDTKEVIARFEAERQALAMMDHPNIAKVFDAGTTETGRPYFVMELVRGIKITEYCDQNQLNTKERLTLLIEVCHAVQHAHQKGIIHRDIKPSNIMVTLHDGVPVPKVIDFGIAKATEGRLTDETVYTQLHQFIGTPAYISPEQAEMSGLDIDTRSDIYSLGVLLYELLAGSTPFDAKELMASGLDAMRKIIREQEPVRPSTRFLTLHGEDLTTTAKRRSTDSSKLLHQIQGDLDWIVMKCLEKDRTRRYETANGLAADVQRHLNNEPVEARPPGNLYKFQKLVRRNKIAFVAGTAIAAALLLGIIASTWQAVRATHAKREALAAQGQAVEAQANEARLRAQAQAEELAARQRAYASDMNVAAQVLAGNNLGRALDLLNRQRPQPGQKDLRGWEWRYLWQQTHSDALFTLCQESAKINSLAISPDGHWLAVGAYHQGGLSVWDLRTRQELVCLSKNEARIRAVFSPAEPLLAFSSSTVSTSDKPKITLHLWNIATRQMVAEFPLEGDCIGLAFSKDARTLVTSIHEGEITLWRVPEGTKLASYPPEQSGLDEVTSFATTPDLSLAAYPYGPLGAQRVCVLDLHNGQELWTAAAAKVWITALAFSPDGKTLASGAGFFETDIRLWDVATGKETGQLAGHGSWVSSLVFSPDGKKLTSSSDDQTIRIWDVANRKCLDVLHGHRQEVSRLALLPDGKTLVSGGEDGAVCLWDTSNTHPRQPRVNLPDTVFAWCFAPDSRSVLTLNRQGQVSRWTGNDFQQKEPLLEIGTTVSGYFSYYQFSQDGRFLAAGATNGILRIWDVARGVVRRQWTNSPDPATPLSFLADGNKWKNLSWSGGAVFFHEWDSATGVEKNELWRLPMPFEDAFGVSPDERWCVAVGYEGDVVAKNLADESQTELHLNTLEAASAAFSPDGKLFAVASDLGYARVWDATTWRQEATLGGFLNDPHTVAFSPDGKRLAIGNGGKQAVILCDTESWQDVLTLEGQGHDIHNLAFSPDGNAIGWLNDTGVLHLWRAPSSAEIEAAEIAR